MRPIAVVMGVSGAGKTTIGAALAHRLGWQFQEGDALHPPENVAKMHAGIPLDDADRAPWLRAVAARIDEWRERGEAGVITCSALKRKYRDVIVGDRPEVRLVYLTAPPALIAERLAGRRGHFMPASLLESQLATLEPPDPDENALTVAVDAPVETVVERIAASLTSSRKAAHRLNAALKSAAQWQRHDRGRILRLPPRTGLIAGRHQDDQSAEDASGIRAIGVARFRQPRAAEKRRPRPPRGRGRDPRRHLEPVDFREGDRARRRLRRADRRRRALGRSRSRRAVRAARDPRHPGRRRRAERGLRADAAPRRLHLDRGLALSRDADARDDRGGAASVAQHRPAQPDGEGAGDKAGPAGDPHADRRGHQRQHHAAVLAEGL